MMKSHKTLIFLCVLITFASFVQTGYCGEHKQTIYKQSDLPTGGAFVPNPHDKTDIYYFTNDARMRLNKSNYKKVSGLYHSLDNGETWFLLSRYFQFQDLFINPVTGRLFAIIEYLRPVEQDGYLGLAFADKAIMSIDGKHWKDISGKQKYFAELSNIFQDPSHPDRVCIEYWAFRSYILQSKDADYSDWEEIPERVWQKDHPNEPKK